MLGALHVLELDTTTGQPKAVRDKKGNELTVVGRIGTERVLFTETYGFPTDWIVTATDLVQIPARTQDRSVIDKTRASFVKRLRGIVTEPGDDQALEVEVATAWLDAAPSRRVVQTWVPGEGWWRSFTRYKQGHLDLEATKVERADE